MNSLRLSYVWDIERLEFVFLSVCTSCFPFSLLGSLNNPAVDVVKVFVVVQCWFILTLEYYSFFLLSIFSTFFRRCWFLLVSFFLQWILYLDFNVLYIKPKYHSFWNLCAGILFVLNDTKLVLVYWMCFSFDFCFVLFGGLNPIFKTFTTLTVIGLLKIINYWWLLTDEWI